MNDPVFAAATSSWIDFFSAMPGRTSSATISAKPTSLWMANVFSGLSR
jgi:hypothetical protein